MRKKDQESQQQVAEICPTNLIWENQDLAVHKGSKPQTAWKARIAVWISLKQTSSK